MWNLLVDLALVVMMAVTWLEVFVWEPFAFWLESRSWRWTHPSPYYDPDLPRDTWHES